MGGLGSISDITWGDGPSSSRLQVPNIFFSASDTNDDLCFASFLGFYEVTQQLFADIVDMCHGHNGVNVR